MAKSHASEIRDHALIASLLALSAALLESLDDFLPDELRFWPRLGVRAAVILLVAGLAFGLVYRVGKRLERRQADLETKLGQTRMSLERIGVIDGDWIDVVWESDGRCWRKIGGSIFKIESSEARGIRLSGDFYELPAMSRSGIFTADAYRYLDDGLVYHYRGGEGATDHHGIGYYDFHKDTCEPDMVTFKGGFLADQLSHIRRVNGRRLRASELAKPTEATGRELLTRFLGEWPDSYPLFQQQRGPEPSVAEA